MKKTLRLSMIFMFFLMTVSLAGCGSKNNNNADVKGGENKDAIVSGDTEWKFNSTIAAPITGRSTAGEDLALGKLEENKVSIVIPKGTFDAEAEVTVRNPESVPEYLGKEVAMLGAPVEISADATTRLNEPVTLSFKYDPEQIDQARGTSSLRVAYHDGSKWEYIKPLAVDAEKGVMTFQTYHFSLFGANQIKDDAVITESWIHSQTLDKQMKTGLNSVSDKVAEQVIDLTLEKMGITDKTIKGKILGDVLKDDGYKGIYDAYQSGDVVDLNQKIALLAGKKIAENVSESALQEGLKTLTEGAEDVAAISKAAGYIAGGQYKDAARIIGEQIADKFVITAAGKIAVEVVNGQIESWKNNEVEAAYTAYRDGANAKFYGYNNEKNDFDTVWSQMRGIGRQLCIEAISKENAVRAESGMPPLTEKQMDRVRASVKENYRKQFEARSAKEEELKKEEEKLRLLVKTFKDNNLFDTTTGPAGLDKGFDYETKLNILYHFTEKMMKDTKRFGLSDKTGLLVEGKLSADDIAQAARFYFTVPDGKKLYQKFIKDRYNISLSPALKDLAGNWPTGKLIFKDVILTPETIAKIEEQKNKPKSTDPLESGCDFTIDPREFKGKEVPLSANITASGEDKGTISLIMKDGDVDPMAFTYNEGEIKASLTKDGATGNLALNAEDGDAVYNANGTLNISFSGGQLLIDISLSKPKQATTPTPPVK